MDKIEKALKKLTERERKAIREIVEQLEKGIVEGLDIKKLKEREDIFRVRKGDVRVIYRKNEEGQAYVLAVERRAEKTYKNV